MCCHDHIYPVIPSGAYWILFLNIIAPGEGTAIQAYYFSQGCNYGTYCVALCQALTAPLLIGWIWSIWHGYEVYKISQEGYMPADGAQKYAVIAVQPTPM